MMIPRARCRSRTLRSRNETCAPATHNGCCPACTTWHSQAGAAAEVATEEAEAATVAKAGAAVAAVAAVETAAAVVAATAVAAATAVCACFVAGVAAKEARGS